MSGTKVLPLLFHCVSNAAPMHPYEQYEVYIVGIGTGKSVSSFLSVAIVCMI